MRSFEDDSGRQWDVAVSDESYGQRLIFAARRGYEFRAHELELYSRVEAEQLLLRLADAELRALLNGAALWQPG
jgi:hypothetical protein